MDEVLSDVGLFMVVSVLFYIMPKIDIRNIMIWLL
ncbi:Uncharacterised protein [Moraxella caprae]|uniref:Uncharacterized protein n=1 Tax=Moraxella caprae TaxID=90240 RepID=A0A378R034_9GAMM|nr:Uncharacterised protein [Moraxella caprae]